jgi:hypothetical protein
MSLELVKDVIIPLASGIGGAIVGAGASYIPARMMAKRASDEILARDEAARRDQDRRAAHQVYVKLSTIANSLGSFHLQIEDMVEKADRDGNSHMPLHQRLSPFAGIEREPSIEFTAEELAIYLAINRPDYMDDLLLLARRYSACLTSLATFAEMKTDFHFETAKLGQTTRAADTGVSTTRMRLPSDLANYIKVKASELDLFAKEVRDQVAEFNRFAHDIAVRFAEITKAYFEVGSTPAFEPIESSDTIALG